MRRVKQLHIDEDYLPTVSSAEAKICLNCPYPDECRGKWDKGCDYYQEKIKKIKVAKNERKNKVLNKACVL